MARTPTKKNRTVRLPRNWIGGFFVHLHETGTVDVPGFGTFTIVEIAARRTTHNFSQGKKITIPAYRRLKFTQSPSLKGALTKRYDQN
jgi:nucleoid DNA-binding protein